MTKEKLNFSLLFILPLCAEEGEKWKSYTNELYPYKIEGRFVNAFHSDINKPWLDNHVFLVFEKDADDKSIDERLVLKDSFTTKYDYRINGVFYDVYVFSINDSKINKKDYANITNGDYASISVDNKNNIKFFWSANESSNISAIMDGRIKPNNPKDEIIPECDDLEFDII